MVFYIFGRVTINQINRLINIYDGKESIELDFNQPVHFNRSKLSNPINSTHPSLAKRM